MKRIAILGSTGSIGLSALAVVDAHPERLQIVGLAAGENVDRFVAQVSRYRPRIVALATSAAIDKLAAAAVLPDTARHDVGREGLVAVASHPDVDIVLCASSGTEALEAVVPAGEDGENTAPAHKEGAGVAGGSGPEGGR